MIPVSQVNFLMTPYFTVPLHSIPKISGVPNLVFAKPLVAILPFAVV